MSGLADSLDGMPVLVLGAGRGRRMGGSKSLMEVEGRLWWAWQDERLREYGLEPHWVVSEVVYNAMHRSDCAPQGAVIADESAPMFASVLVGLASVEDLARGVFLLPVDTPAPRVEHFTRIARSDIPAHPTFQSKGGHPLFLPQVWIQHELGTLLDRANTGSRAKAGQTLRLDKMIEGNSLRVATDDPDVVVNMNEPADVKAWLERRGQS